MFPTSDRIKDAHSKFVNWPLRLLRKWILDTWCVLSYVRRFLRGQNLIVIVDVDLKLISQTI